MDTFKKFLEKESAKKEKKISMTTFEDFQSQKKKQILTEDIEKLSPKDSLKVTMLTLSAMKRRNSGQGPLLSPERFYEQQIEEQQSSNEKINQTIEALFLEEKSKNKKYKDQLVHLQKDFQKLETKYESHLKKLQLNSKRKQKKASSYLKQTSSSSKKQSFTLKQKQQMEEQIHELIDSLQDSERVIESLRSQNTKLKKTKTKNKKTTDRKISRYQTELKKQEEMQVMVDKLNYQVELCEKKIVFLKGQAREKLMVQINEKENLTQQVQALIEQQTQEIKELQGFNSDLQVQAQKKEKEFSCKTKKLTEKNLKLKQQLSQNEVISEELKMSNLRNSHLIEANTILKEDFENLTQRKLDFDDQLRNSENIQLLKEKFHSLQQMCKRIVKEKGKLEKLNISLQRDNVQLLKFEAISERQKTKLNKLIGFNKTLSKDNMKAVKMEKDLKQTRVKYENLQALNDKIQKSNSKMLKQHQDQEIEISNKQLELLNKNLAIENENNNLKRDFLRIQSEVKLQSEGKASVEQENILLQQEISSYKDQISFSEKKNQNYKMDNIKCKEFLAAQQEENTAFQEENAQIFEQAESFQKQLQEKVQELKVSQKSLLKKNKENSVLEIKNNELETKNQSLKVELENVKSDYKRLSHQQKGFIKHMNTVNSNYDQLVNEKRQQQEQIISKINSIGITQMVDEYSYIPKKSFMQSQVNQVREQPLLVSQLDNTDSNLIYIPDSYKKRQAQSFSTNYQNYDTKEKFYPVNSMRLSSQEQAMHLEDTQQKYASFYQNNAAMTKLAMRKKQLENSIQQRFELCGDRIPKKRGNSVQLSSNPFTKKRSFVSTKNPFSKKIFYQGKQPRQQFQIQ